VRQASGLTAILSRPHGQTRLLRCACLSTPAECFTRSLSDRRSEYLVKGEAQMNTPNDLDWIPLVDKLPPTLRTYVILPAAIALMVIAVASQIPHVPDVTFVKTFLIMWAGMATVFVGRRLFRERHDRKHRGGTATGLVAGGSLAILVGGVLLWYAVDPYAKYRYHWYSAGQIPDGYRCDEPGETDDCVSNRCWPGPPNNQIYYCMARASNCAVPGTSGTLFDTEVSIGSHTYVCRSKQPEAIWSVVK
jgi:hypothetical protein